MQPKSKQLTLILIIILMIISFTCAGVGTYYHFTEQKNSTSCDLKINASFCYTCLNKQGTCQIAYNYNDDKDYELNVYPTTTNTKIKGNNYYTFIIDDPSNNITYQNNNTYLYNIKDNHKTSIKGVKDYGVGIDGGYVITLNNNNKWGILNINNNLNISVPYQYDYIGLHNELTTNNLLSSKAFAVLSNNKWSLIDSNGISLTSEFNDPIYDYNDTNVITINNNLYQIYNYDGTKFLDLDYNKAILCSNYLAVLDNLNTLYIYNLNDKIIIKEFILNNNDEITFTKEDNQAILKSNSNILLVLPL